MEIIDLHDADASSQANWK